MAKLRKTILLAVSLACALLASSAFSTPAAGATKTYVLFGGRGAGAPGTGWSFNNTLLSSPGPELTATVGDTVIITVNSTDGRDRSWYLDYNNSNSWDQPEEPGANFPNATTREAVTFSFVANQNGTFQYRSDLPGDGALVGNFTISPSGGGVIPGVDNAVLIIIGVVVVVIAALAVATRFMRRKRPEPPPPP